MGKYNPVTRDSDGSTIRLDKQEAEQSDTTARAKRTTLVDNTGADITTSNRLPVDAELTVQDIEIGSVEIKDGDSDTRLDVELDSAKNAAYVQSESLAKESGGNLDTIAGDTTSIDSKIPSDPSTEAKQSLSKIDSNNSSTATLGIDATFTGTATDVTEYNGVYLQVYSDVASATDGVKIQSSNDGTNWDHEHKYTLAAGSTKHLQEALVAQYYRIVYVNGGSGQSAFRLQTKLLKTAPAAHVHPIDYVLTDDHPASVMRAVLSAQKPNNDYINIDATAGGNLKTSVQEISDGLDIGAGNAGSETQRVSISTDDVNLSAIKNSVGAFDGTTSDGTIALASADTWYAIPSSAPTSDYILVVSLENADGTVRWSFNNGGTPSATNGNIAPNHLSIKVAKDTTLYFGSSTAGDDVNFTYVEQ